MRMVLATSGMLILAFAIQLAVYGNGGHTSLSDLPRVFLHRGVGPGTLPYIDRVIEYPVGSGVLLYLASLVSAERVRRVHGDGDCRRRRSAW